MDRMLQENQALRFEVDVKGNALGESQDRIAALKGEVSKLSKEAKKVIPKDAQKAASKLQKDASKQAKQMQKDAAKLQREMGL